MPGNRPRTFGAAAAFRDPPYDGSHMTPGSNEPSSEPSSIPAIPLLEQPAEYLLSILQSGAPRRIIGLAGVPGSGKSTIAARISAEVNHYAGPGAMVALGMDGFHLTRAALQTFPDPAEAFARRGAPWTFDTEALYKRLQQLADLTPKGASLAWPGFKHEVGDPVEGACTVEASTRIVLVEGLYLLCRDGAWAGISRLFDERWYLDTPLDLALDRLAMRHMQAWGITRTRADARIARNDRLNAEIVAASSRFADRLLVL